MLRRFWAIAAALLSGLVLSSTTYAEPATKPDKAGDTKATTADAATKFLRIRRDADDEVTALDTAIVSYRGRNAQGEEVQVDLVGAVHIGDTDYYRELNRVFGDYEVVLYELVAPQGCPACARQRRRMEPDRQHAEPRRSDPADRLRAG